MRESGASQIIRRERHINRNRLFDLTLAIFVLYFLYFLTGLLYENIINSKYRNMFTNKKQKTKYPDAINFTLFLIAWIFGEIYMKQMKVKKVEIQTKNMAMAGFTYAVGQSCSILAIRRLGYPLVMMAESSSVIFVIIIAVFFTRVQQKSQKLGPKKLIIGVLVTLGIILFYVAAPGAKISGNKKWMEGLFFICFVLISEGLLPDLQAEMKSKFKPKPVQMMTVVNKWAAIAMFIYLILTWKLWKYLYFIFSHPGFAAQLFGHAIIAALGQLFVYKIIKQFKQHILPFVRASRKVLTVAISIAFYGHETNWVQILGICLVLGTILTEFFIAISDETVVFADGSTATFSEDSVIRMEQEMQELEKQANKRE